MDLASAHFEPSFFWHFTTSPSRHNVFRLVELNVGHLERPDGLRFQTGRTGLRLWSSWELSYKSKKEINLVNPFFFVVLTHSRACLLSSMRRPLWDRPWSPSGSPGSIWRLKSNWTFVTSCSLDPRNGQGFLPRASIFKAVINVPWLFVVIYLGDRCNSLRAELNWKLLLAKFASVWKEKTR